MKHILNMGHINIFVSGDPSNELFFASDSRVPGLMHGGYAYMAHAIQAANNFNLDEVRKITPHQELPKDNVIFVDFKAKSRIRI